MIKAKVQLFDDETGKNIGKKEIVQPESIEITNTEYISEISFIFDFSIVKDVQSMKRFNF